MYNKVVALEAMCSQMADYIEYYRLNDPSDVLKELLALYIEYYLLNPAPFFVVYTSWLYSFVLLFVNLVLNCWQVFLVKGFVCAHVCLVDFLCGFAPHITNLETYPCVFAI